MRTLRKVFCILFLAGLVTSAAAMAAPAARSDGGPSIGSVLDSIRAFLFSEEIIGSVDPNGVRREARRNASDSAGADRDEAPQKPGDSSASADDEYGGAVDPNG